MTLCPKPVWFRLLSWWLMRRSGIVRTTGCIHWTALPYMWPTLCVCKQSLAFAAYAVECKISIQWRAWLIIQMCEMKMVSTWLGKYRGITLLLHVLKLLGNVRCKHTGENCMSVWWLRAVVSQGDWNHMHVVCTFEWLNRIAILTPLSGNH